METPKKGNQNEKFACDIELCPDCHKPHCNDKISFCTKCGTCLYNNSHQVPDEMYPYFRCTKCGTVNFWD
jgi:hypothetical protein